VRGCAQLKPHTAGWRLMVMRGVDAVAIVMAGGLLLAGCASSRAPETRGSSVTSTSGLSSPSPMVSVGSPTPSDEAGRSRVTAVTELARRLLAEVAASLPDGSKESGRRPVGNPPGLFDTGDDFIDVADAWIVPGTVDGLLAYVRNHVPAGLTFEVSMAAANDWYRAPPGPDDEGAIVQFAATPEPSGGVNLRVDVHDIWQPLRPATEQVPDTVTGATLVRRTDLRESPSPPTTIHVGVDLARHIAALLNALPSQADGPPDAGGGPDATITVTFDGDPNNTQYAVTDGIYNTVTVNAPGQALPTLSHSGDVDTYLNGLF
jgi:hypothetical protein